MPHPSQRWGRLLYLYSNRLNFGKVRRELNILWSFALHGISMILSLAGEAPTTVPAKGASRKIPPVCGQVLTDTRLIRPTSSEPNMQRNPRPL
jgi:hypothetical protein